ncbi:MULTISPECIES: hypothetical protein [Sulfolobaceae]|uniref:hypothetical protein n=1 Tax=Sulfolobaceae TaxID=118883 RepID=UPI003178092C
MPTKTKFIPQNIQGVRIAYQKLYPFNPIYGTNSQALDTIKLTAQESGVFYIAIYFYTNPWNANCEPNVYPQTQYYPPGSTNYNSSTNWVYNYLGEGSGFAFLARYLQNELICQTVVSNASTYNTNYAAPPPSGGPPWYNYICNYKYNPAYQLFVDESFGYINPGSSAWLVIANSCLGQPYGYVVTRAVAIWEVY